MHRTSIHKKLANCLIEYKEDKVKFFQGNEGRQRATEFKALLDRYGDGCDEDLKPIYMFYLNQTAGSVLRRLIKLALCDLLDIPLPRIGTTYVSVRNPYNPEQIAELIQDRQLNERLSALLMNQQSDVEMAFPYKPY